MTPGEWLARGPFALALSSSYFGIFAHGGVWRAFEGAGIVPARITGASAGAVVAASWAAGLDAAHYLEEIGALTRRDLWDPGLGAGFLRGRRLRARLERTLPVERMEDCRIPLAISVFDVFALRTRALESGPLAEAVHASCAVPLMFHPVRGERWWWDGGVRDPAALAGVPADMRVLQVRIAPEQRGASSFETTPRGARITITDHPRPGLFHLSRGPRAAAAATAAVERLLA